MGNKKVTKDNTFLNKENKVSVSLLHQFNHTNTEFNRNCITFFLSLSCPNKNMPYVLTAALVSIYMCPCYKM